MSPLQKRSPQYPNHVRLCALISPAIDTTRIKTRTPMVAAARDGSHLNRKISRILAGDRYRHQTGKRR